MTKNSLNNQPGKSKIDGVNNRPITNAVKRLNSESDVLDLSLRGFSISEITSMTGLSMTEVRSILSEEISVETSSVAVLKEQLVAKNLARSEWLIKQVLKNYDPNDEYELDVKTGNFVLSVMKHELDIINKATPAQPTNQTNIQINAFTPTLSSNSPLMIEASEHLVGHVPPIFAPDETEAPVEMPHGLKSKDLEERIGKLESQGHTPYLPELEELEDI